MSHEQVMGTGLPQPRTAVETLHGRLEFHNIASGIGQQRVPRLDTVSKGAPTSAMALALTAMGDIDTLYKLFDELVHKLGPVLMVEPPMGANVPTGRPVGVGGPTSELSAQLTILRERLHILEVGIRTTIERVDL